MEPVETSTLTYQEALEDCQLWRDRNRKGVVFWYEKTLKSELELSACKAKKEVREEVVLPAPVVKVKEKEDGGGAVIWGWLAVAGIVAAAGIGFYAGFNFPH